MSARLTIRHMLVLLILLGVAASAAAAPEVVFLVRHAERADGGHPAGMSNAPADPDLSTAGKVRAERLAAILKDADIKRIFVTEFKRTQQTAAALATAGDIEPTIVPSKDVAELVRRLNATEGRVLVIGHSNSLPDILKALGVKENIAIGDDDYDNLFIVLRGSGEPVLVTLKF